MSGTKKNDTPTKGEGATYECARCGTRVSGAELSRLPTPTCANCGYRVFTKVREGVPKEVKAR